MLALLGEMVLDSHKNKLIIENAISNSWDFYEQTCGFRPVDEYSSYLEMNRSDIHKFIRRTKNRTQGNIINFKA